MIAQAAPRKHAGTSPLAIVFSAYWLFFVASLFILYVRVPFLTPATALLSAVVDALSLMLIWVVAGLAAARLPLTGPHAVRNFILTLAAAALALVIRIAALRAALTPLGWFGEQPLMTTLQSMLPRNLITFAVLWIGGWSVVHYRRSARRGLRAATLRLHLVHARLTTLMSRLQPHFVGNALHALSFLIYEAPAAARSMLAGLRAVIAAAVDNSDAHEVLLPEELDFAEQWLEVQRQRFGDALTCAVRADVAAREAWVPRLILQPLVENVIKHAVGMSRRPVHVEVRASVKRGELHLSVDDDGPGLRGDVDGGGVGIANIRERLAVLYDDDGVLTVENRAGGGVSARIRMPLLRAPVLGLSVPAADTDAVRSNGAAASAPNAEPATPGIVVAACIIMTLLLTGEEFNARPGEGWLALLQAAVVAMARLGSILLPAALAFVVPRLMPPTRGRATATLLTAAVLVAGATLVALFGRAGIILLIDGTPIDAMAVVMQGIHLGLLLLNVLAGGYVARHIAEQDDQLSQLTDAETSLLQAQRARLAASLEIAAVYGAFDRIEGAIDTDPDVANREVILLGERLNASLRAHAAASVDG